jgi:flagellar motor switch protein FliM
MLRLVFERMATTCTENLRDLSVLPLQLSLESIGSGTAGDVLATLEGVGVFGTMHAPKWNARLIVGADRAAVFMLVETFLGGGRSETTYAADRAFTRIETKIAGTFFHRIAQALSASFVSIADTPFVVEATSDRIDFDAVGRRNNSVIVAKWRLSRRECGGEIAVVIPKSVFGPMRQALSRVPSEQTARTDPRWSQHIQTGITRTNVTLKAVLDECWVSLEELSRLEVGAVMQLNATPHSRVRVECNDEPLLWCQLGKSNGVYTLRVDELVDREQEFLDDILFG